jgi:hypothetical protein
MPVRTTKVHVTMQQRDMVTFADASMDIREILTSFMVAKVFYVSYLLFGLYFQNIFIMLLKGHIMLN